MPEPVVLLVVGDALAPLQSALLASNRPTRVERLAPSDLVERCATVRVDLVVMDASIDETAGTALLREVAALADGEAPRSLVVFADAADPRRVSALRQGCAEHITGPQTPGGLTAPPTAVNEAGDGDGDDDDDDKIMRPPWLAPLLAHVERLLQDEASDARKDAQARQFTALVEASSDGVYILRGGVFTWANRRFQEMVGYSFDELTAPDFSMIDRITAPESRGLIEARARRVDKGLAVEPRYEFVALRKNGERFDAQVSVAYLDADKSDGEAGALGIMQDITERKSFEQLLVQRNRELQQLNQLSAAISQADTLDDVLHLGCQHIVDAFGAVAAGISILTGDSEHLQLKASVGLADRIGRVMDVLDVKGSPTLLAQVARSGAGAVVEDAATDQRIFLPEVKALGGSVLVVPLISGSGSGAGGDDGTVTGVAFCFLPAGQRPAEATQDLLIAIGNKLGHAIDKASLLEAQMSANQKLVALDEVAQALSSTLDADEVALIVARRAHSLFGAMRVLIATLDREAGFFVPMHVLDDGEPVPAPVPIRIEDTIMGLALTERRPVQRVRSRDDENTSIDPFHGRAVELTPYERGLFRQGVGTAVAVPIILDGEETGALWLGYPSTTPLSEADLQVLSAIGTHVAIANKNAQLFEQREGALRELRDAQSKLVDAEKLNAIGLIAHGVAHDFNNILGAILGRAQLLKSQLRDAAHLKHAEIIEKAAQDGAETVRRIQEIGRQDRVDDFVAVEAKEILNDVVELTRPRHTAAQIEVAAVGDAGLMVAGNPAELREVLINLVHNALDAMRRKDGSDGHQENGSITLRTRVGEGRVIIDVEDNGAGIPADVLPRIFDPYFTTKGERGTGLGLSVSHSIIRRHGGILRATSQTSGPSRGTTFTLDMPAFVAAESIAAAAATATEGAPGRARVLVVDDEENIREILAEMLMTNDHEVVTAQDGAEALHKLQGDDRIDLIFTDLGLPGMSGYEVAQEAKRLRPDLLVGLITGWGATLDQEMARSRGVDLVISKPFRFDEVLGIVDEALLARRRGDR